MELKTINIKGKNYVPIVERVKFFNDQYKNGSIRTELLKDDGKMYLIKAMVIPDIGNIDRFFTGYSQSIIGDGYINKTSALENCETSAIGRALGLMGIGLTDSFASAEEVIKAVETDAFLNKKELHFNKTVAKELTPKK